MVDYLYREIFRHDEYLRHGIVLRPGDTIFDVGANIGLFALRAVRACGNDLRLFAFEPVPDTFRYLQKNLALRGLLDRPGVHDISLWQETERLRTELLSTSATSCARP